MKPFAAALAFWSLAALAALAPAHAQEVAGSRGGHRRRIDLRLSGPLAMGEGLPALGRRRRRLSDQRIGGLDDPPDRPRSLDYEPIGSLAGTMRVKDGAVDFGASDVPLKSQELQKLGLDPVSDRHRRRGRGASTSTGSARGRSSSPAPLLADIYLGKVQTWIGSGDQGAEPRSQAAGRQDRRRSPLRRFRHDLQLHQLSVQGQARNGARQVGSDLLVPWPTGTGAKGNDGVSQAVRQTKNSIGYVEYAHARADQAQLRRDAEPRRRVREAGCGKASRPPRRAPTGTRRAISICC